MIDKLFCEPFGDTFVAHVKGCPVCQEKLARTIDAAIDEIPLLGMIVKKKMGGMTFTQALMKTRSGGA